MGVEELETGAEDGTFTGLVTGGWGGAIGGGGLIKVWLKKVSKSSRSLASRFKSPHKRLVSSGEVPLGILITKKFRENWNQTFNGFYHGSKFLITINSLCCLLRWTFNTTKYVTWHRSV